MLKYVEQKFFNSKNYRLCTYRLKSLLFPLLYKFILSFLIVEMAGKDKKCCGKPSCDVNKGVCEQDFDGESEEQVDIEEQVEQKIKELPTLREKVQAIAINGYLIQKRNLDKELTKQQEEVERKFRQLYKPFVDQINNIIQGKHAFCDADFQEIGELLTPQEQGLKHNYFTNEKIPEFWLKVFMNSDVIGEHVEERDDPLLRHLERVEAGKSEDLKKLWVDFYFSENEWFTNEKLHKDFQLDGEVIKKSSGDQIQWKEGKNITVKIVKKKNKKKGGEKKTKQVKQKSFFNFFLDIEIDSDQEDEDNEEGNQEVEDLEQQYEIAQALYEDIIPKSLEYYLGLIETMDDLGELDDIEQQDQQEDDEPKKKKK